MQLMKFSKSKNGKNQKENLKQKIGEPTPPLQWLKRINLNNCSIFYYLCMDQYSTCALCLTSYLQVNFTLPLNRRLAISLAQLPPVQTFKSGHDSVVILYLFDTLLEVIQNICKYMCCIISIDKILNNGLQKSLMSSISLIFENSEFFFHKLLYSKINV